MLPLNISLRAKDNGDLATDPALSTQLRERQRRDATWGPIMEATAGSPGISTNDRERYALDQNGILVRQSAARRTDEEPHQQICVLACDQPDVLRRAHDDPMGAHFGIPRTLDRVRIHSYW